MRINRTKSTLTELMHDYVVAKHAEEEATNARKAAEEALITEMAARQRKTMELKDGGKVLRATYVQGYTTSINEAGLKKALGARVFNKVAVAKVDRKKLEAAMAEGTIDAVIVGQHVTEKPSTPYVRYTEAEARADDE